MNTTIEHNPVDPNSGRKSSWFTLITSPNTFFETRRDKISWLWVVIIMSIISLAVVFVEWPYLEKSPQYLATLAKLRPDQVAVAKSVGHASAMIGGFISPWLMLVVGGFLIWVLVKLFGAQLTWNQSLGLVANASVIPLLANVLGAVVTVATGEMSKGFLSLGMVIHSTAKMQVLLSSISVFAIWEMYILTIGVSKFADIRKGKAFGVVLINWILGILIALAMAR